jgi:hypothetical protein
MEKQNYIGELNHNREIIINYATETEHPDEVIFNTEVQDEFYEIYKPNGELLARSNSHLALNDALLQIKRKKLNGYTISTDGGEHKSAINTFGHVPNPPANLCTTVSKQLRDLYGTL